MVGKLKKHPIKLDTPHEVGESYASQLDCQLGASHPHVRGEKKETRAKHLRKVESSPRTWGKAVHTKIVDCEVRVIPTHVGNRVEKIVMRRHGKSHPHMNGGRIDVSLIICLPMHSLVKCGRPRHGGVFAFQREGCSVVLPSVFSLSAYRCRAAIFSTFCSSPSLIRFSNSSFCCPRQ